MDYSAALQQLEAACADFQLPEKRAAAEQTLLEFKRTPNVLPACRFVLEHSNTPLVQFHTALAVRESLIHEYALLSKQDVADVRDYIFSLCYERVGLERFVLRQLMHVYAVILKRSWMDLEEPERGQAFAQLNALVQAGGQGRTVALAFYEAILDEFSSTKASRIGLTLHYHQACKNEFTEKYLLGIFEAVLRVIHQEMQTQKINDALRYSTLLLEKIFSWDYTSRGRFTLSRDTAVSEQEMAGETPEFPASWKSTLLDPTVLSFFFDAYDLLRHDEAVAHRARQCLVQLSGIHGPILDGDAIMCSYATLMMRGYDKLLAIEPSIARDSDAYGPYLLGLCQMMQRLVKTVPTSILCEVDGFFRTMSDTAKLTVQCLRGTVAESDDTWNMEAFDELLDLWITLSADSYLPLVAQGTQESGVVQSYREDRIALTKFLEGVCQHIVDTYLETRLEAAKQAMEDDEADGSGFSDQEVFGDQLTGIARLARLVPQHSLASIQRLLIDRTTRMRSLLTPKALPEDQQQFLHFLHEHIHWLLMISGYVLADAGQGEHPMVPVALLRLSTSQAANGPDGDQVVQLSKAIFELATLLARDPSSAEAANCSPLVAETLFWCLERPNLVLAFGGAEKSGHGQEILHTLIQLVHQNVLLWNADSDVLTQIIRLLNGFTVNAQLRNEVLNSFAQLVTLLTENLERLPETLHSEVVRAMARIILYSRNIERRDIYIGMLTNVMRFAATVEQPNFASIYQDSNVVEQVRSMIEMLDGLAQSIGTTSAPIVYAFCSRYFEPLVELVRVYRLFPEVITDILSFFASLYENMEFDRLPAGAPAVVCQATIALLRAYEVANKGRKRTVAEKEEAEPYPDIVNLINMLTNLMGTELVGFDDHATEDNGCTADVIEVVFFGLGVLVPAMDNEMLNVGPSEDERFISDLVELQYDRLIGLPTELQQDGKGAQMAAFATPLDGFLQSILQSLVFNDMDNGLIKSASEALYPLICTRRAKFEELVQSIVSQQPTPELQQRLLAAFGALNDTVPGTMPRHLNSTIIANFYQALTKFLLGACGFLRII
ncbi:armadillo-type protein [Thamnocephalis sphaerospora]|uniref:Exportin-4 n=1 Tax=Thamnocephalis sphaerospora TaxID=78915 RepID=A0A4P9XTA8_9FUNG|nr:armadillo-type protein [Thamnocephalis sphaerospora]|eukprot:RKP09404.1 armadillo-type protein [Thamnocephalis sphaerospora]